MILMDGGPEGYNWIGDSKIRQNMDNKEVTAAWAHKTATNQLGEIAKKELDDYLNKIKVAVCKNQFSIEVSSLTEITKKEIENRGFKIKYFSGAPMDGNSYIISW